MNSRRRSTVAFVPSTFVMESRLAPSGNFLSHGFADLANDAKAIGHHHHAERSMMEHGADHGKDMVVHYHHVNAK